MANKCLLPSRWEGCYIVFGNPGVGKTAFLSAIAVQYLNYSTDCLERYNQCKDEVNGLIADGYKYFELDQPPVYSNYPIKVHLGAGRYAEPYYIDGFGLAFENKDFQTLPVFPKSCILLSEAQRYYNSRRQGLSDYVCRFYEERRHFGLLIVMDVQRPDLIDLNIRDIADGFYLVDKVEVIRKKYDRYETEFTLKFFKKWKHVEAYKSIVKEDDGLYEVKKIRFPFNVFNYYKSKAYYKIFLPTVDFSRLRHAELDDKDEDNALSKVLYRQSPPDGFYKKKGG